MPPPEAFPVPTPAPTAVLGILLLSGEHERAHYAFMLAAGAAAIGRRTVLFATNRGCHALCRDWSGLAGAEKDNDVRARGVAGLHELREAAAELGVSFLACDAGLRLSGLTADWLLPGVAVAGIPSFLSATAGGQLVTL